MPYFIMPILRNKCLLFRVSLAVVLVIFVRVECIANGNAQAVQFTAGLPHDSVEKHEVVEPKQLSSEGLRWRRSITTRTQKGHHLERVSFSVFAFGRQFILDLTLNRVLMPVTSQSTHYSEEGSVVVQPYRVEEHCYYQGVVKGLPDSSVAVSTCQGLEGLIFDGNESYYIEPVKHKNNKASRLQQQDHIFYRMNDLKLPPTKCGHDMLQSHHAITDMYKLRSSQNRVRRDIKSETKYVELIIVNDFDQYDHFKRNLDETQKRARTIANLVDSLYRPLNIRVALIDMITWSKSNPVEIVTNSAKTLDTFMKWRNEKLIKEMKRKNDNAHLLTHKDFEGATVGKAHVMAMCTSRSAGVVQDHSSNAAATAATFAHEMGHNFGMGHDEEDNTCKCQDSDINKGCIMSGVARSIPATKWSSCSEKNFNVFLKKGLDFCLFNQPRTYFGDAICGNGFKEEGEECDCGTAEECRKYSDGCCNSTTCKLLPGSECVDGPCCSKCKLKPSGIQCRKKVTECDLPEYCDGKSELCPANRFVHNGKSCANGKGYCYLGACPTLDGQCKTLWGPDVKSGPALCYTINTKGQYTGSCGKLPNGTYVPCKYQNIKCGMLHCTNVKTDLPIIGTEREVYTYTWPTQDGGSVQCKSAILDLGNGIWNDGGMAKDGIMCGQDKVCIQRQCRNVTELLSANPQCPNGCSNKGVCDNVGNCFCDACWTGKDCNEKTACTGAGASSSNVAGIVFLVFFIILVIVLAVVAFIKRDFLKAKWQERKESRSKRYQTVQKDGTRRTPPPQPTAKSRQISSPMSSDNVYNPTVTTAGPVRPAPGKIELPSWPQDKNDDSPAAVPAVARRPPPPRPMAPKDASLHRASSPPGFAPGTVPAARPAPAARPGSLAGVLDRKPLPGIPGKKPGPQWPPLNKSASDSGAIDKKPINPPPPPPTRPGKPPFKPVLPVCKPDEETTLPVKPSDIKKAQEKAAASTAKPNRPVPGKLKALQPVPGKPLKRTQSLVSALVPPGAKKTT